MLVLLQFFFSLSSLLLCRICKPSKHTRVSFFSFRIYQIVSFYFDVLTGLKMITSLCGFQLVSIFSCKVMQSVLCSQKKIFILAAAAAAAR